MDKLNKELRQCNLQQFIQQTGTHIHTDLEHLEKIEKMHFLPKGSYNGMLKTLRCPKWPRVLE